MKQSIILIIMLLLIPLAFAQVVVNGKDINFEKTSTLQSGVGESSYESNFKKSVQIFIKEDTWLNNIFGRIASIFFLQNGVTFNDLTSAEKTCMGTCTNSCSGTCCTTRCISRDLTKDPNYKTDAELNAECKAANNGLSGCVANFNEKTADNQIETYYYNKATKQFVNTITIAGQTEMDFTNQVDWTLKQTAYSIDGKTTYLIYDGGTANQKIESYTPRAGIVEKVSTSTTLPTDTTNTPTEEQKKTAEQLKETDSLALWIAGIGIGLAIAFAMIVIIFRKKKRR